MEQLELNDSIQLTLNLHSFVSFHVGVQDSDFCRRSDLGSAGIDFNHGCTFGLKNNLDLFMMTEDFFKVGEERLEVRRRHLLRKLNQSRVMERLESCVQRELGDEHLDLNASEGLVLRLCEGWHLRELR